MKEILIYNSQPYSGEVNLFQKNNSSKCTPFRLNKGGKNE